MNILIIPAFIYTHDDPTLGSFVFEQAEALAKHGHNVYLLYCDTYSIKYCKQYFLYKEKNEERNGVHVYRTRALCLLKHKSGFYGTRKIFTKEIINLYDMELSNIHIDMIHAHCCAWAGYAAMKLSNKFNIPYVITEHSTLFKLKKEIIKGRQMECIKAAYKSAGAVLCVSAALERLISEYTDNTVVIGNVIDTDLFSIHSYSEENSQNENFTFLTVCYLKNKGQIKKKGIDILIAAFAEVLREYPQCQLKIGGGGDAISEVEKLISNYGITEKIIMLGALSRQEVSNQMCGCDCFVLPSRYETFGVVYAEALACGKPIIGTKTGGPDSFVNNSNGILVDVEDVNGLVEAMKYMVNHKSSYDPQKLRNQICREFSSDAVARKLEEKYDMVRGEKQ